MAVQTKGFDDISDEITTDNGFLNLPTLASEKINVYFDELPLTLNRMLSLKGIASAAEIKFYDSDTRITTKKPRRSNFAASTNLANKNGYAGWLPINDEAIMRRFLTLELKYDKKNKAHKIDYEYYENHIDVEQVWAQAAYEALLAHKRKDKKMLSWEVDENDFIKENRKYLRKTEDLITSDITSVVIKSDKGKGEWLSATQILARLEKLEVEHTHTAITLGKLLAEKEYTQTKNGSRGWWVRFK